MKSIILTLSTVILLFAFIGAGCQKDEFDAPFYKGKIISLNPPRSGCQNIIEIIDISHNAELSVGTTISFDPQLSKRKLNEGKVIYFKVIEYGEFEIDAYYTECTIPNPEYSAIIEFINN